MMGLLLLLAANLLFPLIAAGYLIYFLLTPRRGLLRRLDSELAERFMCYTRTQKDGLDRPVWLHAASVGEVKSVIAVTVALKAKYPNRPILLTTSTAAGRAEAQKNPYITKAMLAPLDFYPLVSRFIKLFHPACLIIVETELWPSMMHACRFNGIEVCILNGRLSAKSIITYSMVKPLMEQSFRAVSVACLQTEEIAARYRKLGLPQDRITVTGNIKYDLLTNAAPKIKQAADTVSKLKWADKRIIVCGSTHPIEEEAFAETFAEIAAQVPGYRIIAAPRHLERAEQTCGIFRAAGLKTARLTELEQTAQSDIQVLVADTMGWLTSFYTVCEVCFVGGTIAPKGGHNLLEAAIAGKPVIFGPHTGNTPETAIKLKSSHGGFEVTRETLVPSLIQLLMDPAALEQGGRNALETAQSYKGATERALRALPDRFFK